MKDCIGYSTVQCKLPIFSGAGSVVDVIYYAAYLFQLLVVVVVVVVLVSHIIPFEGI